MSSQYFGYNVDQSVVEKAPLDNVACPSMNTGFPGSIDCSTNDTSQVSMPERRSTDKRVSRKSNREVLRRKDGAAFNFSSEVSGSQATYLTSSDTISSKEVSNSHKVCIFRILVY